MVGRALDREVERDLDPELAPRATSRSKSSIVPSSGLDRGVAALLAADRPRAARVAGLGGQRVVAALAVREPDRVDRREVDDVEAEVGELGQLLLDALEPAPRAREELVPGAEARQLAGRRRPRASGRAASARSGRARSRRAPSSRRASAPSSSAAPSSSSLSRSFCPASTLRRSSSRHDAMRSTQASIVHSQRPQPVDVERPGQRSGRSARSGASSHFAVPGAR